MSSNRLFALNDESYSDLNGHNSFGGEKFAYRRLRKVPYHIRSREEAKYRPKLRIWIAISEEGYLKHYSHLCSGVVNQHAYRNQCLKRLYPFMDLHVKSSVLFWPYLSSSHHARSVIEDSERNEVSYVPEECNPPNVPHLHLIGIFWSHLKAKTYRRGFVAKKS